MTESTTDETISQPLTLKVLQEAVRGNAAAIRQVSRLEPAGDPGDKVFPSTYQGGVYATETRRINGQDVKCVLLDSVQSQANRMEQALLAACNETVGDKRRLEIPLLAVEFKEFADVGKVTALDAPHRIADAIFRDSTIKQKDDKGVEQDVAFRVSKIGQEFEAANMRHATALFTLCPTALIFGTWDSTGSKGGLGNKFARAIVSEIVGMNATTGVHTSSRIDPLVPTGCSIFQDVNGDWTVNEDLAIRDDQGNPTPFKRKPKDKGKISEINLGNVTPSIDQDEKTKEYLRGGATIDYAQQTTVLSLAALRRLEFPNGSQAVNSNRNYAARTVLAALGLVAITLQREQGYFLRSRCDLIPFDDDVTFEIVRSAKTKSAYTLTADQAIEILNQAVAVAKDKDIGLEWPTKEVTLQPTKKLIDLVGTSRVAGEDADGEGE